MFARHCHHQPTQDAKHCRRRQGNYLGARQLLYRSSLDVLHRSSGSRFYIHIARGAVLTSSSHEKMQPKIYIIHGAPFTHFPLIVNAVRLIREAKIKCTSYKLINTQFPFARTLSLSHYIYLTAYLASHASNPIYIYIDSKTLTLLLMSSGSRGSRS